MLKETHELITKIACEYLQKTGTEGINTEEMVKLSWAPDEWEVIKLDGPGPLNFNGSSFLHFSSGYHMATDFSIFTTISGQNTVMPLSKLTSVVCADWLQPIVTGPNLFETQFPRSMGVYKRMCSECRPVQDVLSFVIHCTQDNCLPHHLNNCLLAEHSRFERGLKSFAETTKINLAHFFPYRSDSRNIISGLPELDLINIYFSILRDAMWETVRVIEDWAIYGRVATPFF